MTNNQVLRKLRYSFDYSDDQMIELFVSGGYPATRPEISNWMKKDDHEEYKSLPDKLLATYLNGLINEKRGKREGAQPEPEETLNNNIILRKIKIALNMTDVDMVATLKSVNFDISKGEINNFFRKPGHEKHRTCLDQILRNFLHGIEKKYHPGE
jgi:uncharacterized protein YehS (DUF1456 family)